MEQGTHHVGEARERSERSVVCGDRFQGLTSRRHHQVAQLAPMYEGSASRQTHLQPGIRDMVPTGTGRARRG